MAGVFSVNLPYKVRCDLPECRKGINYVFKIQIDGIMNKFCSSAHARIGEKRWLEKKELNIRPDVTPKIDNQEEMVADNLNEIENE